MLPGSCSFPPYCNTEMYLSELKFFVTPMLWGGLKVTMNREMKSNSRDRKLSSAIIQFLKELFAYGYSSHFSLLCTL